MSRQPDPRFVAEEDGDCPLNATVANVLSRADVMVIMTEYWVTGERSAKYGWDDISQSWLDDELAEADGTGIKAIKPKGNKGPIA